jgi:inner membrane protein
MDSVSQAALGAAIGEAVLGRKVGHRAALAGAIVATIPDLDVMLVPFFSEVQKISLHRGYSHSILFCIIASLLLATLFRKTNWLQDTSFRRLWIFHFLALSTHVILDAFTSYGTQLFLPLTDWRVSFDSISIIDPVYTLPLLSGVLLSVLMFHKDAPKRSLPNNLGIMVSSLYLLFTLANKQNVQNVIYSQLEERDIPTFRLLTVPVSIGNAVWYGVAKDRENLYLGRYSTLKKNRIEFHQFPINDHLLDGLDEYLIDRLTWFAQGFYTVAEKDGKIRMYNMQCDMQGVRQFGDYKAPTAFYYEVTPLENGKYILDSGMHPSQE